VPEEPQTTKPKRRVRYSGTHPRKFSDKYKELNPEKYPETVAKVIASGKTPAGMHRPIMVTEIVEGLAPKPGETGIDCTLGYGGHALELLKSIQPGGKLIALDADPLESSKTEQRFRALGFDEQQMIVRNSNFAALPRVLGELSVASVDFILADLGVSSMQLDTPERGFSFKLDGPLDLRLNPTKGRPASLLLQTLSEEKLVEVLRENSDEDHAHEIAQAIISAQHERPIETTLSLRRTIEQGLRASRKRLSPDEKEKSVRRSFQALRILVNDEFGALDQFLRILPESLSDGGRVAILTFHSGEDRRVKKRFQELERSGVFERVSGPLLASPQERGQNPRSASAKLRWAVKSHRQRTVEVS